MEALYDFSARFFDRHGVERAGTKWQEVKGQMEKTVGVLDSLQSKQLQLAKKHRPSTC